MRLREYVDEFRFPELLSVDRSHLRGDIAGGITSAVVALPLALGFGILAYGGDPRGAVAGLYGAIFTGILASLFGGTPRQITGPTGGMTVILTMVYKEHGGADALLGACLIAGILQIVYGIIKSGRFISFIPYPVIVGFTNGIAILIFSQQIPLFADGPLVGLLTIVTIAAAPLVHRTIPRALAGLIVGTTVAVYLYPHVSLLRYGLVFDPPGLILRDALRMIGEIPRTFSAPHLPSFDWATWSRLFPAGLTISLLGALETLLASVVADSVTGDRHNSNRELIGQGIANFTAGLFGGIAGTGAIVRTNVNIRAGGVTRLSGIMHGLVLIVIMLVLAPLVGQIPLVVLAGVLMMTAVGMFEWEPLRLLPRTPVPDAVVMLATMTITVISDLITAVLVGFALSGFLFVYRMSSLGMTNLLEAAHMKRLPPGTAEELRRLRIAVFDVEGPLFFGAAKNFVKEVEQHYDYRVVVINMENVPVIDTTGALALEDIVDRLVRDRKKLVLAGLRREVRAVLHQLGVTRKLGIGNIASDMDRALRHAIRYAAGESDRVHLGAYLTPDLVLLDLAATSKEEVLTRMAERAYRLGFVTNKAAFLRDLWDREEAGPTGIGNGIAIPHSRSGSTGNAVVVIARLATPVPFGSVDDLPVRFVFMIAASPDNDEYLQVLSLLAKALHNPALVRSLSDARQPQDVYEFLLREIGE